MRTIDNILNNTSNRYYPLPERPWKYYQQWDDTLFLHWQVPLTFVEELLPRGVIADTYNGIAWVSLVGFTVRKLRMRCLPVLPYVSNFEEINLRTYVVRDGIPGIYMFSIEASKLSSVLMTRFFIGLPYMYSKIMHSRNHLISSNRYKNYRLATFYKPGSSLLQKTSLDFWLTERHCLYQVINKKLYRFDIHHEEWHLQDMIIRLRRMKYRKGKIDFAGQLPDKLHYCKRIRVVLWGKLLLE